MASANAQHRLALPENFPDQNQFALIARAVVGKPQLLIADEPTGNLDPELALEIMQLFKRFNDVGVTVVVATHDAHLIDRFSARCLGIRDGRMAAPAGAAA